jgi:diacylglycerol kinase (ATP)
VTEAKRKRRPKKEILLREGGLARSFNSALEGIVYALRTQRNAKIHFAVTALVLFASVWLSITKIELILLLITIALVLVTEMMNSSLEVILDLTVERYHPLARIAKDVAAGAVLFSALNAVLVGYLIFFERLRGGRPSGHAAAAFGLWAAAALLSRNPLIAAITFILALIIAISRVRMGIHSVLEVTAGALLGVGVTAFCFWVFT